MYESYELDSGKRETAIDAREQHRRSRSVENPARVTVREADRIGRSFVQLSFRHTSSWCVVLRAPSCNSLYSAYYIV